MMRVGARDWTSNRRVAHAVIGKLHLNARVLVRGRAQPVSVRRLGTIHTRGSHVGKVQTRAVRGVDLTFHNLRPVAGQVDTADADLAGRSRRPGRRLEFRHFFAGAHIDPYETTGLVRWI